MSEELENNEQENIEEQNEMGKVIPVSGLYENWFLDYASYVILERAVPHLDDGLKPVQRRVLHSMKTMDDGRYHKVANIIGHTMQYHPHGDAAIGAALVNVGQKDLLIDTQGNWGDIRTGDSAAASRYIEARLTKFALEVMFNKQTTEWQVSYDGRNQEPVTLPAKFPLLLAQGVEGIAVGLSTKIMPHNFIELIEGSIKILNGKKVQLYPDFLTGGMMDCSDYQGGKRGGRIKVRAKLEIVDKKTIIVKEIPYGTTTNSIIDSIIKANDKNKIKIKKVVDNTARDLEILIELPNGVSPELTLDGLYAFTDCEVSISPNACVIVNNKPIFVTVDELLTISTERTKDLLRQELEIRKGELGEKWHFSSLEKIFIENRIYRDIEECETWEAVIDAIDLGLEPFKPSLNRDVTEEDIVRLTEIKIKRISKFDTFKADEVLRKIEEELEEVQHHLNHLTDFSIAYFENLMKKYSKGRERKTEIRTFETIKAKRVVIANEKLFVNRAEGFVGFGLKKEEFISECSDIDDVIVFLKSGKFMVVPIADKVFVGKDIMHVAVWKKGNDRKVYHLIYSDVKAKANYVKRFSVTSITRNKEYDLTTGNKGNKVLYFSVHPNGEEEVIAVQLSQGSTARKKLFEFDFGTLGIKGRGSKGNVLTKYPVRKITQKSIGPSSLGGVKIWLDRTTGRLNKDERGDFLGEFDTENSILVLYKNGSLELTDFSLNNRYEIANILSINKFEPEAVISVIHYDGNNKTHYVKRFLIENTSTNKPFDFITDNKKSKIELLTLQQNPVIEFLEGDQKEKVVLHLKEFIDVKGWKSLGNKLSYKGLKGKIKLLEPVVEEKLEAPIDEKKDDGAIGAGGQIEWDFD